MANVASTWPFKSSYKTNRRSTIMPKRPPIGLARGFAVKRCLHQKRLNLHLAKITFPSLEPNFGAPETHLALHTATQSEICTIIFGLQFCEHQWNPFRIVLPNGFWWDAKLTLFFALPKVAPNARLKKHYKTLIILHVGPKCTKIMNFSQLDLKCILKNQKSEK